MCLIPGAMVAVGWLSGISRQVDMRFNSFPASGDFCPLLITFANNLDPEHARENGGPDLEPNY